MRSVDSVLFDYIYLFTILLITKLLNYLTCHNVTQYCHNILSRKEVHVFNLITVINNNNNNNDNNKYFCL